MKRLMFVLSVLSLAGVAAGCGKHTQPPPEAVVAQDQAPAANTNAAPSEAPGPDAQAPALPTSSDDAQEKAPSGPPNLGQLTLELHHWIANNQRHPKSFEDFAASAHPPIPPAPEGKKYAISQKMSVILVNR